MGLALEKIDEYPAIVGVRVDSQVIVAAMSDGREVSLPIAWFPRLMKATEKQRKKSQLSPGGYGVHWPEIDEDISVKAFINGL